MAEKRLEPLQALNNLTILSQRFVQIRERLDEQQALQESVRTLATFINEHTEKPEQKAEPDRDPE